MTNQQETYAGEVAAVLFRNEGNGYTVLKLRTQEGADVTVVGALPFAAPGEQIEVTGVWASHRRHGAQFKAETVNRRLPATEAAILTYLSSGVVKGIGGTTAGAIVSAFGAKSLDILEREPEKLATVKGISMKKALAMGEAFAHQSVIRRLMEFLNGHGFPPQMALRLYQSYGNEALAKLRANPYLLIESGYDASFAQVDRVASALSIEATADIRVEAGLLCQLHYNANQGHVFLPRAALTETAAQLLEVEADAVSLALQRMNDQNRIVGEGENCYLPLLFAAECDVAGLLTTLAQTPPSPVGPWEAELQRIESDLDLALEGKQRQAVRACVENALFVLTGGPGTGKTTTIRVIVELFNALGLEVALAAPTGRAAKRMSELTGQEAATIHRLLEIGFDDALGGLHSNYHGENPLKADVLILDETSMIDIQLMQTALGALKPDARLILVGDADQLPSVGPGNVLRDILRSGVFASIQLTEIFRQAAESRIVVASHRVNAGEVPDIRNEGDLYMLKRADEQTVIETLVSLCRDRLPAKMGLAPEQIQVITPTRRGLCGTVNLNAMLQQAINPPDEGKPDCRFGNTVYRLGDRVMQIRNNYDLEWVDGRNETAGRGVFNGDTGFITALEPARQTLTVTFADREVEYPFDLLYELELAYAITVHKAQGSEFPAVLFVSMPAPAMLLNRKVLYTAMTRARSLLVVVGRPNIVAAMVQKKQGGKRFTSLRARIAEMMPPEDV